MDAKYVRYELDGEVATVTIDRPRQRNVISRRVYRELDDAFARAENDDGVKVIVVAGAGDHFGGGHDLGTQESREELPEYPRDFSPLGRVREMDRGVYWRMHDRWRNIGKPTIAMVQGYCIMGSWMLVAACDLVVAADDAKFADRSVRWGGAHHEYPTHFLDLGSKKAKEHLWTGDFITAEEAERAGFVNHVVPREKLREATMWLARRVALNDLLALKLSKMSINQAADILGESAAIRASGNFWILGGMIDRGESASDRVAWSKERNERFDAQERAEGRPW
ncbi:MAG: enoyl-CoA hydratase/isomerase family protein [Dehalococcoidia bacterium]|nr:enoyl-CoA hydratase/isomerase family protein [Dehalococcoidia bacterium]MCA9843658.1 enoyl-CoA hydratase/isomerase family protein [Dehalococcoidia bacterium]